MANDNQPPPPQGEPRPKWSANLVRGVPAIGGATSFLGRLTVTAASIGAVLLLWVVLRLLGVL